MPEDSENLVVVLNRMGNHAEQSEAWTSGKAHGSRTSAHRGYQKMPRDQGPPPLASSLLARKNCFQVTGD